MNAHDSERIKGMLESLGLGEAVSQDEADVLVFNTCTIREKPDQRFAAHLAQAAALKQHDPEKVIAVGGCYAEAQRERLFELYPSVDVAFGPGSIPHLADWIGAGGEGVRRGAFGLEERSFAGELPMRRERAFQAWVQISMGCNSKCAYCIVPSVRGREQSRPPGDVLAEVDGLAREGVREITLLGQHVNSYGRHSRPRAHDRSHRRLPGRDRGRLRGDARGGRGSRLRQRVHVRLLATPWDGGGNAAGSGGGRG